MLELRRYCPRTDLKRGFSARTCGRTDLTQSVQVFTGRRRLRLASFRRTNPIRPTSTLIPGSPATFSVTQSIEKKKRNEATTLAQRLCPPTKTAAALTAAAFANSNGSLRTTLNQFWPLPWFASALVSAASAASVAAAGTVTVGATACEFAAVNGSTAPAIGSDAANKRRDSKFSIIIFSLLYTTPLKPDGLPPTPQETYPMAASARENPLEFQHLLRFRPVNLENL